MSDTLFNFNKENTNNDNDSPPTSPNKKEPSTLSSNQQQQPEKEAASSSSSSDTSAAAAAVVLPLSKQKKVVLQDKILYNKCCECRENFFFLLGSFSKDWCYSCGRVFHHGCLPYTSAVPGFSEHKKTCERCHKASEKARYVSSASSPTSAAGISPSRASPQSSSVRRKGIDFEEQDCINNNNNLSFSNVSSSSSTAIAGNGEEMQQVKR